MTTTIFALIISVLIMALVFYLTELALNKISPIKKTRKVDIKVQAEFRSVAMTRNSSALEILCENLDLNGVEFDSCECAVFFDDDSHAVYVNDPSRFFIEKRLGKIKYTGTIPLNTNMRNAYLKKINNPIILRITVFKNHEKTFESISSVDLKVDSELTDDRKEVGLTIKQNSENYLQ